MSGVAVDGGFVADDDFRSSRARLRFVGLFDHRRARDSRRAHGVRSALGQIRKSAGLEDALFAARLDLELAVEDVEKSLRRSGRQRAAGYELRGHLSKARAQLRRSVDDELHPLRAGQRRANERVRRLQQMIGLENCCALIQVGARAASFREMRRAALRIPLLDSIRPPRPAAPEICGPPGAPPQHLLRAPFHRDGG